MHIIYFIRDRILKKFVLRFFCGFSWFFRRFVGICPEVLNIKYTTELSEKKIVWLVLSLLINIESASMFNLLATTYIWRWKLSIWLNPSTGIPALRQVILLLGVMFNMLSLLIIMSCVIEGQQWKWWLVYLGLNTFWFWLVCNHLLLLLRNGFECKLIFFLKVQKHCFPRTKYLKELKMQLSFCIFCAFLSHFYIIYLFLGIIKVLIIWYSINNIIYIIIIKM